MRLVVTGATGQAGSRVTEYFAEQGHDVLGIDRR
jgi:nucleoside-diphosphate-sugar epimerase